MLLARTHVYQGLTRCYLGDLPRGIAALRAGVAAQEALAAAGQPYTPLDAVDATNGRGTLADFLSNAGQLAEARALAEAHLAGAPPSPEGAGAALYADTHMAIGMVAALQGRPEEARAHYLRAAAIYGQIGHRHIVVRVMVNALHYVRLPYEADRVGDRRRDAAELTAAVAGLVDTVKVSEPPEATQTGLLLLEGRWAEIHDVVADLDEPASSMVATLTETQGRLAIAQGDDATRTGAGGPMAAGRARHRAGGHILHHEHHDDPRGGGPRARRRRWAGGARVAGGARPLDGVVGCGARSVRGAGAVGAISPAGGQY